MKNGLESAYDYCQELTRREAKNFYYGFVLLPSDQRRAIYAAYAFARRCDDIVDEGLPIETASERLQEYRASLDSCLAGCPDGPAFEALRHAIDACRIPPGYFHELIDGVQMDLTVTRYNNFDDLKRYCYLVASVVAVNPGDTLIFHTDGILHCVGVERKVTGSPQDIADGILKEYKLDTDDALVLVAQYRGDIS